MKKKLFFISIFLCFLPFSALADTLYEYYNTGDNANDAVCGVVWRAETFTATSDHHINSFKLKLYRVGLPLTAFVSLKATDISNKPTGDDLATGTLDADTFTEDTGGEWYDFDLGVGYDLLNSQLYAIVLRAVDCTDYPTNYVGWRMDTGNGYASGQFVGSGDSGASWTIIGEYDLMFEIWDAEGAATTTAETILDDSYYAYFFVLQDYFYPLISFFIVLLIVANLLTPFF